MGKIKFLGNLTLFCTALTMCGNASAFSSVPSSYVVDVVATASFGVDMNDVGDVIGTSYLDNGCGSSCLPPLETVVWKNGVRIVLPTIPGLTGITVTGINNLGWICGWAGYPYTITHAVVWKPNGSTYDAIDLGNLPGKNVSTATGIDDLGRVVGWSTTQNFPPVGAPFMWTEADGIVNLADQGFPNEQPLGISPGGSVATFGYWYHLGDPSSAVPMPAAPLGFGGGGGPLAINDAGDQARFLVDIGPENLVYPFRFHHEGTWQQISFVPTGHLSSYGVGSINDAQDITATVGGTGMIAYGPDGSAQSVASFVSPAYGGSFVTSIGPLNSSGQILAKMIIGQSGQRLVKLTPGDPCISNCIRVNTIQMKGKGPAYCDQGRAQVKSKVIVTDEAGVRLAGVTVTIHYFDDYWLDEILTGVTNSSGTAVFAHSGPPCIGAIAILVTDATSAPARTLDRTTGILTDYIIPLSGAQGLALEEDPGTEEVPPAAVLGKNYPNPFNPSTSIQYSMNEPGQVSLTIYNMLGQLVKTLVNDVQPEGIHEAVWDGTNETGEAVTSGTYIYRLTAGSFTDTERMLLLK